MKSSELHQIVALAESTIYEMEKRNELLAASI